MKANENEDKGTDWLVDKVPPLASLPLTDVKRSEMEKQNNERGTRAEDGWAVSYTSQTEVPSSNIYKHVYPDHLLFFNAIF